jgi:hypothetical protein
MASYFTAVCFPELALLVRTALTADEAWNTRSELIAYLQCSLLQPSRAMKSPQQQHMLHPLMLPAPAVGELEQWLVSIHPTFATYAAALTDYGYEDLSFLREVETAEFEEALAEVGMTKPAHRALALRRFQELRRD